MKNTGISILAILMLIVFLLTACGGPESPLEDNKWILTSYTVDGETREVLPDTEVTILFESDTGEISGIAGCNHYTGSYEIEGRSLSIPGPIAATEMWCGDEIGRQEQEYLEVLLRVKSFEITGDTLRIDSSKGTLDFRME
jgi:heat shock protein HslJ